jgi:cytochrome c553
MMVWVLSVILLAMSSASAQEQNASFDYDALQALIQSKGVRSVEELIPLLPPELRSSYSLVYDSKSSQGSSDKAPRAILFGKNANFVLTFNGDPGEAGYNKIETMQFKPSTNKFEFREIEFPKKGGAPTVTSCTGCHGDDPHPIWGNYPSWPGVYGSADEHLGEVEVAKFKTYQEFAKSSKRYSSLLPPRGSTLSPYRDGHELESEDLDLRPNTRLGLFLARMNARRIAKRLEEKGLGKAALFAISCSTRDLSPLAKMLGLKKAGYDDVLKAAGFGYLDTSLASYNSGLSRSEGGPAFYPVEEGTTVGDRGGDLLVAGQLSVDYVKTHPNLVKEFPLSAVAAIYSDGYVNLGVNHVQVLGRADGILEASGIISKDRKAALPCLTLRKQIRADLISSPCIFESEEKAQTLFETGKQIESSVKADFAPKPKISAVLENCSNCHSGISDAPYIPFNEPEKLSEFISKNPYFIDMATKLLKSPDPKVRMPFGSKLPVDVTPNDLIDYFKTLK